MSGCRSSALAPKADDNGIIFMRLLRNLFRALYMHVLRTHLLFRNANAAEGQMKLNKSLEPKTLANFELRRHQISVSSLTIIGTVSK